MVISVVETNIITDRAVRKATYYTHDYITEDGYITFGTENFYNIIKTRTLEEFILKMLEIKPKCFTYGVTISFYNSLVFTNTTFISTITVEVQDNRGELLLLLSKVAKKLLDNEEG